MALLCWRLESSAFVHNVTHYLLCLSYQTWYFKNKLFQIVIIIVDAVQGRMFRSSGKKECLGGYYQNKVLETPLVSCHYLVLLDPTSQTAKTSWLEHIQHTFTVMQAFFSCDWKLRYRQDQWYYGDCDGTVQVFELLEAGSVRHSPAERRSVCSLDSLCGEGASWGRPDLTTCHSLDLSECLSALRA